MASSWQVPSAKYSSKASDDKQEAKRLNQEEVAEGQAAQPTEEAEAHPYADFSREELSGLLLERDSAIANCQSQVSFLDMSSSRCLAPCPHYSFTFLGPGGSCWESNDISRVCKYLQCWDCVDFSSFPKRSQNYSGA